MSDLASKDILSRPAQGILLATFGISLVLALRNGEGVETAFERYIVGFLSILFFREFLKALSHLGLELDSYFSLLGSKEGLRDFIARSLKEAGEGFSGGGLRGASSALNYVTQIFRTGVWGVASSLTELVFLLARFLLEVSRDILWQILFILFPLGAGFFPIFPKILLNMALLAVELCFWLPVLTIIDVATSLLARKYSAATFDLGFYVLACEIVAILLTLSVPSITHKIVSGGLSGDSVNSVGKTFSLASSAASKAKIMAAGFRGTKFAFFPLFLLPLNTEASSSQLSLSYGYVTKLSCRGRLLISSLGDERLFDFSALPKEVGCAVYLRPRVDRGKTNLILETTAGTIHKNIEISKNPPKALEINLEEK